MIMMCYKDKAWCSRYYSGECINHSCFFALTSEERALGKEWWGGENFPISLADRKTDECDYTISEGVLCKMTTSQ
jgi:hypothetical protein